MLLYFLYTTHILTCLFLILVVLLQRGKGADLSVFGGGATQAAFGARGTATLLHKLTVGFFVAFIVTTLSIAMVQGRSHGTTVLSGEGDKAAATKEAATTEEGAAAEDGSPATALEATQGATGPPAEGAAEATAGDDTGDTAEGVDGDAPDDAGEGP